MIYEVRARLLFDVEDEAKDFLYDCERALAKATTISPDSLAIEYSTIEEIENHHDEEPNEPCVLLSSLSNQPAPPI